MHSILSRGLLSLFCLMSIAPATELDDPLGLSSGSSSMLLNITEMTPLTLEEDPPVDQCGFLCGRLSCFYGADEEYHDSCSFPCMNQFGCGEGSNPQLLTLVFVGAIELIMLPAHVIGCTANACAPLFGGDEFMEGYRRGSTCYPEDACSFSSVGNVLVSGWDQIIGFCWGEEKL